MTRFHWTMAAALTAAFLALVLFDGGLRWALFGTVFAVTTALVWLGVCHPALQMFGRSLCRVPTARKLVALTFDDGPDSRATPPLLDLLERRGARATFFCVAERAAAHEAIARRIVAQGHEIGNHSHAHHPRTNLFSLARLRADLGRAQAELERIAGARPVFFRPPMTLTNPRVFKAARELGLQVVGYSRRGLDRGRRTPEQIAARATRRLRPGAILLLHDGGADPDRLLRATSLVLDRLAAEGYACVPLGELVGGANP